jgi:hypothetical protein
LPAKTIKKITLINFIYEYAKFSNHSKKKKITKYNIVHIYFCILIIILRWCVLCEKLIIVQLYLFDFEKNGKFEISTKNIKITQKKKILNNYDHNSIHVNINKIHQNTIS